MRYSTHWIQAAITHHSLCVPMLNVPSDRSHSLSACREPSTPLFGSTDIRVGVTKEPPQQGLVPGPKVQQGTWNEKCSLQRVWLFKLHKLLIKSVWQLPYSVLLGEVWVLIILFCKFIVQLDVLRVIV